MGIENPMISVCMTSFNGEKYIEKQIDSILACMGEQDELIISDDGSTDGTRELVDCMAHADGRIRLIQGPKQGVIANFENAIRQAKGDIIYLADQDDIWTMDKVEKVQIQFADPQCMLVIHDADIVDGEENKIEPSFFQRRGSKSGILNNIAKNSYIGCCMAFRRELLDIVLPIPRNIEMHDQWIGILAETRGKVVFLDEVLFHYRRHGDNVSSFTHYPIPKMIRNRVVLVMELAKRLIFKRK